MQSNSQPNVDRRDALKTAALTGLGAVAGSLAGTASTAAARSTAADRTLIQRENAREGARDWHLARGS